MEEYWLSEHGGAGVILLWDECGRMVYLPASGVISTIELRQCYFERVSEKKSSIVEWEEEKARRRNNETIHETE